MSVLYKILKHVKAFRDSGFNLYYLFFRIIQILNRRRHFAIYSKFYYFIKRYEGYDEFIFRQLIKTSKKFNAIDIGANIGIWSITFSKYFKNIYAFEPQPKTYSYLKKYTKDISNIETFQYALGEKEGIIDFYLHEKPGSDSAYRKAHTYIKTIKVKVLMLDQFNFDNIGFIKIDTEGFELPILMGSKNTIFENKPQLYIEIHDNKQIEPICRYLDEMGYKYNKYLLDTREYPHIITK